MQFNYSQTIDILSKTPELLSTLLHAVSDDLARCNERPGTWSVFDVIGHLVYPKLRIRKIND